MRTIAIAVLVAGLTLPAFAAIDQSREGKLYDKGSEAVDNHEWSRAARTFRAVAAMHDEHADAALYWLAYAQNKMGMRPEALASIVELRTQYPKSRWNEDARTLEVEIRQSAGQQIEPERVGDEDAKLIVLSGMMASEPDRALPMLTQIVISDQPVKTKKRALFVLSQSGNPKAFEVLDKVALDPKTPELQAFAVRYLGLVGGRQTHKILADVYAKTKDVDIKRDVLRSMVTSGDRQQLLVMAKGESNSDLRGVAIMGLGTLGARDELSTLYTTETSPQIRGRIIQSIFISGGADKLVEIATNEKAIPLRIEAIRNLGMIEPKKSGDRLVSIYNSDTRPEVRRAVIQSLCLQRNAAALAALEKTEKDPALRRDIERRLSLMHMADE
jgi:HEAT repeat protein